MSSRCPVELSNRVMGRRLRSLPTNFSFLSSSRTPEKREDTKHNDDGWVDVRSRGSPH